MCCDAANAATKRAMKAGSTTCCVRRTTADVAPPFLARSSRQARRAAFARSRGNGLPDRQIDRIINESGGEAKLRTAEGGVLLARMNGPTNIVILDAQGNIADIAIYDVRDKNGIVHVVDRALEPGGLTRQMAAN